MILSSSQVTVTGILTTQHSVELTTAQIPESPICKEEHSEITQQHTHNINSRMWEATTAKIVLYRAHFHRLITSTCMCVITFVGMDSLDPWERTGLHNRVGYANCMHLIHDILKSKETHKAVNTKREVSALEWCWHSSNDVTGRDSSPPSWKILSFSRSIAAPLRAARALVCSSLPDVTAMSIYPSGPVSTHIHIYMWL